MTRIVFFDLETTGTDPFENSIYQLGAAAYSLNPWFDKLETLELNVRVSAESISSSLPEAYRIDVGEWNTRPDSVSEQVAIHLFGEFLNRHATVGKVSAGGAVYYLAALGGYNIIEHDLKFIRRWCAKCRFLPADIWPSTRSVDVAVLVNMYLLIRPHGIGHPDSLKLGDVARWLGVEDFEAHSALPDAEATAQVAAVLLKRLGCDKSHFPE